MELETVRIDNSIKELLQRGTDKWGGSWQGGEVSSREVFSLKVGE